MVIYSNLSKAIVLHTVFLLSKHIVKHMEIRSIVQTLLFLSGLLTVSVPQDPYDVQDGNSITIPCIVTGNPMATEVRWKKIDTLTLIVRQYGNWIYMLLCNQCLSPLKFRV
jgi:hypothetical protein